MRFRQPARGPRPVREPGQGVAPVLLRRVTSGGAVGREAGAEPVDEALKHQGPGAALPEDVRRDAEARLGTDFARVRVHTDPAAGRAARAVGARAFAFGEHIFFAYPDPNTAVGDWSTLTTAGEKTWGVLNRLLVIDDFYWNLWSYFGSKPFHALLLAIYALFSLGLILYLRHAERAHPELKPR